MYLNDLDSLYGDYVWCLGCNRAYRKTDMTWDQKRENYECKYEDCHFQKKDSFWPYDVYRRIFGWPQNPVEGKKYKMKGS